MQTFLNFFHQGEIYSLQIDIHQVELRREGKFTDQKYLSVSSLHTDYLNLDSSLGFRIKIMEEKKLFRQSALFVKVLLTLKKNASRVSDRKKKNLVWLVIRITDKHSAILGNILDVDMKIT